MSISLSNGHARATVLSAVWSPTDEQLVAVLMAATDKTVLTALKAELEKNNKTSYVALAGEAKAELAGARRGHVHLSASLDKVNAQGHITALLHWRANDPRTISQKAISKKNEDDPSPVDDYFYVVARHGEMLPDLFLERLQLTLAWPLKPEWSETLLHLGRDGGLVENLPAAQSGDLRPTLDRAMHDAWAGGLGRTDTQPTSPYVKGLAFMAALRVVKCDERWGAIISEALASHAISF